MGYTTTFYQKVKIEPALNKVERKYLMDFNQSRRMDREKGPYYAYPGANWGQGSAPDIREYNTPPKGQPGLWCKWMPNKTGTAIIWSGAEKFYDGEDWMTYLIEHFLKKNAYAKLLEPEKFSSFQDHMLNGIIYAKGESDDDIWRIVVKDNKVFKQMGTYEYPFDKDKMGEDDYYDAVYEHDIQWKKVQWTNPLIPVLYKPFENEIIILTLQEKKDIEENIQKTQQEKKNLKL